MRTSWQEPCLPGDDLTGARTGKAVAIFGERSCDLGLLRARQRPVGVEAHEDQASFLLGAGEFEDARIRLSRSMAIAPDPWLTHLGFGLLELAEQRTAQGIAALRRAATLPDATRPRAVPGVELARLGQQHEARSIHGQWLSDSKIRYVLPTSFASLHAALGEPRQRWHRWNWDLPFATSAWST
ncbi:hypothetical protein [Variovorax rhizosphaerae]|uniref:Tetratricopeptide repeat protein n=1 Tax=Variovorax rhizosphaerae TaxID=1836200 RepID=A0ABU8WMG3_9BURK